MAWSVGELDKSKAIHVKLYFENIQLQAVEFAVVIPLASIVVHPLIAHLFVK